MFSVVIPLYNKSKFISSTLEAVLLQDFQDYEIIVIDDGSTDGSAEIVAAFQNPRIRLLQQSNKGVGAARNLGINVSNQPWVAFLDADDLWSPQHLYNLHVIITTKPQSGFISTRCECVESLKEFQDNINASSGVPTIIEVNYFDWTTQHPRYFQTPSIAVKRDLLNSANGFKNVQPGEDIELWARLALTTQCAIAQSNTVWIRKDNNGITANAKVRLPTKEIGRNNLPTLVLQLLDEKLRSNQHILNRRSIERYFDYRLLIGMRLALLQGDRLRVWKLWRLMIRPFRMENILHIMAAAFPLVFFQRIAQSSVIGMLRRRKSRIKERLLQRT